MTLVCKLLEVLFEVDRRDKFDARFILVAVVGHIRYQFGTVFLIVAK